MAIELSGSPPFPSRAPRDGPALASAVREILATRKLTIYRVAVLSRSRYPGQRSYHIRPNFYFQLRSGQSPTMHQLIALSDLTGYRLWDWLALFGFSLSDISRFQALLGRPRTGLLATDLVDPKGPVPLLQPRRVGDTLAASAPLGQLLAPSGTQRAAEFLNQRREWFLYAKIGTQDALAFPELVPGSIIRANPRLVPSFLPRAMGELSNPLFLIAHGRGLSCGRLRRIGLNRVALVPVELQFAENYFELGTEARVLGVVDLEYRFRPAIGRRQKRRTVGLAIPAELSVPWTPLPMNPHSIAERPGIFLRRARLSAGLSFRCGSRLSRQIARTLGDYRYFASPGTLSDYEADEKSPRHIHKLFTLAILYAVSFRELLRAFGITTRQERNAPKETVLPPSKGAHEPADTFFKAIARRFGDVPLFLGKALSSLTGITRISLRDFFWVGGQTQDLHPSLQGALFLIVNRRSKNPFTVPRASLEAQPLYLVEGRDGNYLGASCSIEDGRLTVYAYPRGFAEPRPIRRQVDAEVVGQIVGVVRSLLPLHEPR